MKEIFCQFKLQENVWPDLLNQFFFKSKSSILFAFCFIFFPVTPAPYNVRGFHYKSTKKKKNVITEKLKIIISEENLMIFRMTWQHSKIYSPPADFLNLISYKNLSFFFFFVKHEKNESWKACERRHFEALSSKMFSAKGETAGEICFSFAIGNRYFTNKRNSILFAALLLRKLDQCVFLLFYFIF